MFIRIYQTTLKRILRSPLFYLTLAVVAVLVFMNAYGITYGKDQNDDFVLGYHKYHELISNLMRGMMQYIIPCLCVVTVMTVVNGDYSDNFFEIERSGGVRSVSYFFGRILAILTVLLSAVLVFSFFSVNFYFFTRGGTSNFTAIPENFIEEWPLHTLGDYLLDSSKIILRLVFLCQLPVIILFTSVTYMLGALLESGFIAGIGGSMSVVLAYLTATRYQWAFDSVVYKYFLPARIGSYLYLAGFDTVFGSDKYTLPNGFNPYLLDTLEGVLAWLAVMLGLSLACIAVSFVCTYRRKI